MSINLYIPETSTFEKAARLRINEISTELAKLSQDIDDALEDVKFFALRMTECATTPSMYEMQGWAFEAFEELMKLSRRASNLYAEKEGLYDAIDEEEDLLDGIPEDELKAVLEELLLDSPQF